MCSHQCVMDVTFGSFLVFFSLISVPIVYISISPFWHFFVVERTLAWHWWCKQLQNQEDVESEKGGGVGGGVWHDTVTFLVFKNGGTSPGCSHRGDSEEEDKRVHDFSHLTPAHCAWIRCSLSFLTPRSCTRLPRSGFARCTACRWALRCTFWSCWYLGWTWLWTD